MTDELGVIPDRVHYRESADPDVSCATCSYFTGGKCTMFEGDPVVSPSYVCDEWQPIEADHAVTAAVKPVPVSLHNRAIKSSMKRVDELEPKLAAVLEPILAQAGVTAARNFSAMATNHLTAAIELGLALELAAAADITPKSTMIAVYPRPAEAAALAEDGGEDPAIIHVTLCYLGQADDDTVEAVRSALTRVAATHPPLEGVVGGVGAFDDNGNGVPAIVLPDVPGLVELRQAVCEAVLEADADYARTHGYTPHATIAYREKGSKTPARDTIGEPLHFDSIKLVQGDKVVAELPLTGVPTLTAAGSQNPPQWSAPAPDEIINVTALIAELKARTGPVRTAMVKTAMSPALEQAGVSWEVTNPFTAKVLAQSGSQITNIAQTTQLNVMKIIKGSYDQGLSIPDTAEAIQAGMKDASVARATLIARTELAGAANGGSLAATQIVAQATGDGYYKQWMTAPGAMFPRHEDYPDLDGQTVQLEETFQVGEDQLEYPGDPDGSPDEVCNCRCTLVYTDSPAELTDDSSGFTGEDVGSQGDTESLSDLTPDMPDPGDAVSVGTGPFVPEQYRQQIASMNLDAWTPQKSELAAKVFGDAQDTTGLYKVNGEWTADRQKLHDQIVAAHFDGKVAAAEGEKTAYFTAGGGASGKSSAIFDVAGKDVGLEDLAAREDVVAVDPDRIKTMLPEYNELRDQNDFYAASGVHEESSEISKRITAEAQRRGMSMIVDTTGSSSSFVQKLADVKAAGYDVKVTMFSTPTNEAIARSMSRGDKSGRYVAIQALKKAHAGASQQLGIWKDSPNVKAWRVYDNSAGRELVASGGAGQPTVIYDQKKFDAILAKANEQGGT